MPIFPLLHWGVIRYWTISEQNCAVAIETGGLGDAVPCEHLALALVRDPTPPIFGVILCKIQDLCDAKRVSAGGGSWSNG